jgi:hypothetical protein
MEILDTLIERELNEIRASSQPVIAHGLTVLIKANGKEVKALYVNSLTLSRLYTQNFADELIVEASFITGDYEQDVVPYRDQLEVTLIKTPYSPNTLGGIDNTKNISSNTYKAQILDGGKSATVQGDSPLAVNKGAANKFSISEVKLQLFNPVIDSIRKVTFGTVFRKTSAADAIKWVLTKVARPANADNAVNVKGVQVLKDILGDKREHIVVKDDTPVIEVPMAIHSNVGGIYPTGFHYYLQNRIWYIYPLYDYEMFGKTARSLTVIKIPANRMPTVERTYRWTNTQVVSLTTKETKHYDVSESEQLNDGNGTRFLDAEQVMNLYEVGGNRAIAKARDSVSEVIADPRGDKSNMVTQGRATITDKYNIEYSELARKAGSVIQTIWENANAELLFPGMPVRYIFMDGKVAKEMYGVLHAVETIEYATTINAAERRFQTNALLTLFVQRVTPLKEPNRTGVSSSHLVNR